jgi:small subunit ribosomal protein S17
MAKTIIGTVSSNKNDKTIVVTVQERKTHPLYRKQYTASKKFMAHDEKNQAEVGDKVSIVESKPLSARKRFVLSEIIEKPKLRDEALAVTKKEDESQVRASKKSAAEEEADANAKAKPEKTADKNGGEEE